MGMLMCELAQNLVLNIVPCRVSTLNLWLAGTEHRWSSNPRVFSLYRLSKQICSPCNKEMVFPKRHKLNFYRF